MLELLAATLKQIPNVKLQKKPRMADFAILGYAMEKALGLQDGSFASAYESNRKDNITAAMEHSPIVVAITQYINARKDYEGNYEELYQQLTRHYKKYGSSWPKSSKGLANQLKRHIPALSIMGIEVICDSHRKRDGYHVSIRKKAE